MAHERPSPNRAQDLLAHGASCPDSRKGTLPVEIDASEFALARGPFHRSGVLFIQVVALNPFLPELEGVVPERKTCYGGGRLAAPW